MNKDIHNSFQDIHKSIDVYPIFILFKDIQNELWLSENQVVFMDIHNSFLDIHKSIYGYPIFN